MRPRSDLVEYFASPAFLNMQQSRAITRRRNKAWKAFCKQVYEKKEATLIVKPDPKPEGGAA